MSEQSPELFLILHKVRGEPAFDVAACIGEDSDGEVWVIPTSGHRAYPYWLMPLKIENVLAEEARTLLPQMPDGWPDHYTLHEQREKYGAKVSQLLKKLGLAKKKSNIGLRPL